MKLDVKCLKQKETFFAYFNVCVECEGELISYIEEFMNKDMDYKYCPKCNILRLLERE